MSAATEAEARRRVEQALQHLQRAQEQVGEAQSLLSSLIGGMTAWEHVGKTYDRIRADWHRVEVLRRKSGLDLDGVSGPAFEARSSGR